MRKKFLKNIRVILYVLAIISALFFSLSLVISIMRDEGLLSEMSNKLKSILRSESDSQTLFILYIMSIFTSMIGVFYVLKCFISHKNEENNDSDYYNYLKSKITQNEFENFDENTVCDKAERDDKENISKEEVTSQSIFQKKGNTEIYAHMMKNLEETTEYFIISKSQAKQSHMISLIACIAGVSLLFIAILILLSTQRVDLAVIPAASGAITEVVSGTVLWVYNKSSSQLNHYYDALHENERFLSIVNLVGDLSPDKQDIIYMEIIRSQLDSLAHTKVNVSADTQSPQNARHSETSSPQE